MAEDGLRVHLLGQPRLFFDGASFQFAGKRKALPLLAYLLLHRSNRIARDFLAFTLWPDTEEPEALAALRRALHELTKELPPSNVGWIVSADDTLAWNPEARVTFDAEEFEAKSQRQETLEEAVALYDGDLLQSLYDDWTFAERERLRTLYLADLFSLIVTNRSRRDFAKAVAYARRALAIDPWREDVVRQLVAIRYEAGDRAGALAEFDRFARRLREEMDVAPMPESTALRELILRNAPAGAPALESQPASTEQETVRADYPMVGRRSEVEHLREAWSRAVQAKRTVVLIGGEAGIGKSRLSADLAVFAESQGARVMTGLTSPTEPEPYQAIAEAFRSALPLVAAIDVDAVWLASLSTVVREVRDRITDLPALVPLEPAREQQRLFDAFVLCLTALAKPRPLLFVLEDLHWAGESTIAALEFLCRRLSRVPVLIVGTYRVEEVDRAHPVRRLRRALQKDGSLVHVSPRRLTLDATAELVSIVPALAQHAAASDLLYARSEGNPLFLIEAIREQIETRSAAGPDEPTTGIRKLIEDRVARLGDNARALAEIAAVGGVSIEVEAVRDVSGWSDDTVTDALSELVDRDFLRDAGARGRLAFAFTHHVIQSVIYEQSDAEARVLRHRRFARVLEGIHADRASDVAAVVAGHYDRGGEPGRAAEKFAVAAARAFDVFAHAEVERFASRGRELTVEPALRYDLLMQRERARALRGDRAGQRADLDAAEKLASALRDERATCACLGRRIALHRLIGEVEEERLATSRLLEHARAHALHDWLAEAYLAQAKTETLASAYDDARAIAEQALEAFASLGNVDGEIRSLCLLVEISAHGGAFTRVRELYARAVAAAAGQGDIALIAQAAQSASQAFFVLLNYAESAEFSQIALDRYRMIGDRAGEADSLARLGAVHIHTGDKSDALRMTAEAAKIYEEIGMLRGTAAVLTNFGVLAAKNRLLDESDQSLSQALVHFVTLGDVRGQVLCTLNMQTNAVWRADRSAALELAQRGLALAKKTDSPPLQSWALMSLGMAQRDLQNFDVAVESLEAARTIIETLDAPLDVFEVISELALAHLMAGNAPLARSLTDECLAFAKTQSFDVGIPEHLNWLAARAYRATGDAPGAAEFLDRAYEVIEGAARGMDPPSRGAFLKLDLNREVLAARDEDRWPSYVDPGRTAAKRP
jgi:DNA-binding SARP family transcriptional activator